MVADFSREFKNTDLGIGELSPGSTPRRYEPKGGIGKHNARIHKESKQLDSKNLPFSFSKPFKVGRQKTAMCKGCGEYHRLGVNAVGVICNSCHQYCSVEDVNS